jgi:hypothetical protein
MTRTEIYRQHSGDQTTHHRTIDKHLKRLPKATQRMIADRAAGQTLDEIAAKHHITRGSVGGRIARALTAIHKAITGAPRYWKVGRTTKSEQPQTVCPDCGAQPGEPCRDGNGYRHRDQPGLLTPPLKTPHKRRPAR